MKLVIQMDKDENQLGFKKRNKDHFILDWWYNWLKNQISDFN